MYIWYARLWRAPVETLNSTPEAYVPKLLKTINIARLTALRKRYSFGQALKRNQTHRCSRANVGWRCSHESAGPA